MSSINTISHDKLSRLIGTPNSPLVIDVRSHEDFEKDIRLIPGSVPRISGDVVPSAEQLNGLATVVVCQQGNKLSHGVAAYLRSEGVSADVLEDGFEGWRDAKLPLLNASKLPKRDGQGRTTWVTRERPKVDRIACPWLIKRFVDPHAVFLFVPPPEVVPVGEKFSAAPFDIEGVFWSHRGDQCTFDVMLKEFGLETEPLMRLAAIVRGADTARPDLAPQAPGLLAVSLGLSRLYADDLKQLDAGLILYDALYRWCRDATGETHNWPTNKVGN